MYDADDDEIDYAYDLDALYVLPAVHISAGIARGSDGSVTATQVQES